jgi:hypothetical protein
MENTRALSAESGASCEDCQDRSVQWRGFLDVLKTGQNAVFAKENLQYFEDCVKIKKWEHEIATTLAKSQKAVGGETVSAVDGAGDNGAEDGILSKLEELKERKNAFERDYISTPNPFVTYCKMKSLLSHIQEEDPEICEDLRQESEALWKSITSHV